MVLDKGVGIENGFMTTIHSYTGDQRTVDQAHNDLRRSRAAATSMIPTSTGAASALSLVLPNLKGKLDGTAIRVPTPNVSLIDLTFVSKKKTDVDAINKLIIKASKTKKLKNILTVNNLPLVSIDFNHNPSSSIFDLTQTQVLNNKFCRVLSWYDNEWGFSNRMIETMMDFKKHI
jgi:glyceraldehyde 3-phosphate dehydrogenase